MDRIAVVGTTNSGKPTVLMIVDDADEAHEIVAAMPRNGTVASVVLLPAADDDDSDGRVGGV